MSPPTPATWDALERAIVSCRRCPRLRRHCEQVAKLRRAAYRHEVYWGQPVPGFGDRAAWLWVVGLAPGAHGANRTGRVFTGDRSGDFLYSALHRAGLASQPHSTGRDDGMALRGVYISAAARCAPPGNRPTPAELTRCTRFLDREWALLPNKRVILALGGIAWKAALAAARRQGVGDGDGGAVPFGHARRLAIGPGLMLMGSYHVSQQNTFTGRLTKEMFDSVLDDARSLAR